MELPKRKNIRLQRYDYSQAGYYFITICTHNRKNMFGKIADGKMVLNQHGRFVYEELIKSEEIRKEITIDKFVVMPNHLHSIVIIDGHTVGSYGNTTENKPTIERAYNHTPLRSPSKTIGAMVRGFKSSVTTKINSLRNTPQQPVWQRSYYDHIIRNQADYQRIWEYIDTNVFKWEEDEYYSK